MRVQRSRAGADTADEAGVERLPRTGGPEPVVGSGIQ
jgi:hypothetical protein